MKIAYKWGVILFTSKAWDDLPSDGAFFFKLLDFDSLLNGSRGVYLYNLIYLDHLKKILGNGLANTFLTNSIYFFSKREMVGWLVAWKSPSSKSIFLTAGLQQRSLLGSRSRVQSFSKKMIFGPGARLHPSKKNKTTKIFSEI